MNKIKILISTMIFTIASLFLSFNTSALSNNITSSMTVDEVMTSVGLGKSDDYSFDYDYVALTNTLGTDWNSWDAKYWFEILGVGEGVENDKLYTYFIIKNKCGVNDGGVEYQFTRYDWCLCGYYGITDVSERDLDITYLNATEDNEYGKASDNGVITIIRTQLFSEAEKDEDRYIVIDHILYDLSGTDNLGNQYYKKSSTMYYAKKWETNTDGDVVENDSTIPTFKSFNASEDKKEIIFKFDGYNPTSLSVTNVKISDKTYALKLIGSDTAIGRGTYSTDGFNLDINGTRNYTIDSFTLSNSKTIEVNQNFRYVSTKVAVTVEARAYVFHDKTLMIDNTHAYFNLINKEDEVRIENAISIQAKYYIGSDFFTPTINVKGANGLFNIGNVFSKEGELEYYGKTAEDLGFVLDYMWQWNFNVTDFDVVYITYEKDGELIKGSCYENGLHVEYDELGNPYVYDLDGVLQEEYTSNENGLVVDIESGSQIETDNPPVVVDEADESIIDKFFTEIDNWFKNLFNSDWFDDLLSGNNPLSWLFYIVIALVGLFLLGILLTIVKPIGVIIKVIFKIITLPFVLIYKAINSLSE